MIRWRRRDALFCLLTCAALFSLARAVEPIPDAPFWQEFREPFVIAPDAADNDLLDVAVDSQGTICLATPKGLRVVRDRGIVAAPGVDIAGPVFALERDANGAIWIGAWNGLYRAEGDRVELQSGPEGPIAALASCPNGVLAGGPDGIWLQGESSSKRLSGDWATSIRDLALIGDTLWVATSVGLYRVADGATKHFFDQDSLCSRDCRALAVAPDGRLWVGTADGIDVFDGDKHVERFQSGENEPPAREMHSLVFDSEGSLWAGTAQGAIRFAGDHWSLRHSLRWLPSDEVRAIAIDGKSRRAYVATSAGLAILDRKRMTLADKAAYYETIVRARHVRPPGLVEKCVLERQGDLESWKPTDTDNDGQYTGTYLAAESYRFSVTGDPQARQNARDAYAGLEFLQRVTGTPGFFARTVIPSDWTEMADANRTYTPQEVAQERVKDPRNKFVEVRWRPSRDGKWLWKGDTSSDEMTGHLYAYGVYFDLAADETEKRRVAEHVCRIVDYLIAGGFELRDTDGQPTRWGVWSPRRLNDDPNWRLDRGINSTEMLSYLATAHHMTGDKKYVAAIRELVDQHGYGRNVEDPQMSDPGAFTYIDSELLAMAYRGLFRYDADPVRLASYRVGRDRWAALHRHDHSPFYDFALVDCGGRPADLRPAVDCLREVPLDMIQWTVDNSRRNDVRLVRRPYADTNQVDRLLPADERAILKWDSNPFHAVAGEGGLTESPAVSWLWPYWMGRHLGIIGPPQAN